MFFLVGMLIFDTLRKGRLRKKKEQEDPSYLFTIIIPAIIASLVAQGLLPKEQEAEIQANSLTDLEHYLIEQQIFESREEIEDWILKQPELVGYGDSIFGYQDHGDFS